MRINRIELYNIGSYEGINEFNVTSQSKDGHIVVVGGKNGAGKTTLFTAIKVCLYGHKEAGYEAINAFYKKSIKRLINDKAKVENNGNAYVVLDLDITNGQGWDNYVLKREWNLEGDSFEIFTVLKNGENLSMEEIYDFDNFLMNIIPPELFELYFFDGEQIADFFLDETGNERIKNAFLTICGYDTFEIILKNFRRLSKNNVDGADVLSVFFETEDKCSKAEIQKRKLEISIQETIDALEMEDSKLKGLEERFRVSGGLSKEEWNKLAAELKNEERFREEKNVALKNAANEIIPYIILNTELQALLEQINDEQETEKRILLKETVLTMMPDVLADFDINVLPTNVKKAIITRFTEKLSEGNEANCYLNLSKIEFRQLSALIARLLMLKKNEVVSIRKAIKKSIVRCQEIRGIMDQTNVAGMEKYLDEKQQALNNKMFLVDKREQLLGELKEISVKVEELQAQYKKAEKDLEKMFKNESLTSLTAKSVVFLESLQNRLFRIQIAKVEELFMKKMEQLRRKERFIDKIEIDDNFNIKLYKSMYLDFGKLSERIAVIGEEAFIKEFGNASSQQLLVAAQVADFTEFILRYSGVKHEQELMVEFDKNIMSKGEKQVFIMALYWAIMQLCNKVVPFIIDTPFARIDTEHRAHITEFFFKELKGQVFIFSTNEEITAEHMYVIGNDLQAKFLIENIDNTRTTIHYNKYFEV